MADCCFKSKNCNGAPKSGRYAKGAKPKSAPRKKPSSAPKKGSQAAKDMMANVRAGRTSGRARKAPARYS